MQLKDYPDVLTVEDLMEILHIGKNKVYELLKNNIIHYHRIGRYYRIPKYCVEIYIRSAQYGNI